VVDVNRLDLERTYFEFAARSEGVELDSVYVMLKLASLRPAEEPQYGRGCFAAVDWD